MSAFDIVATVLLALGSVFCIIGGIGIVRLPNFYTRTHGASITDTMGAGLVLFGLAVYQIPHVHDFAGAQVIIKLFMVLAFLVATSPTAGHALVKAAYARGVKAEGGNEAFDAKTAAGVEL